MPWNNLGLVFDLKEHNIAWIKSHAMLPTPLLLDDRIRVYFTARDEHKHSRISFVDLALDDPSRILYVHDQPLMAVGKLGTFDDSGTLGTCAIQDNGTVYLYYNGYNLRVTVPWSNAIGVAVSKDGGVTFDRLFEGPVVDRNPREPYFVVSPAIVREGGIWHMWYTSGTGWTIVGDVPEPLYVVKYAQSTDGIVWQRDNVTCIPPQTPREATARPAVIKEDGLYKMWFCYRGSQDFRDGSDSYRIGYAESTDRTNWVRDDARAGIVLGETGWDEKMQAYPAVLQVGEKKLLFYNGNGFGVAGFGCATWK